MVTGEIVDVNVAPLSERPARAGSGFDVHGRAARIEGDESAGVRTIYLHATAVLHDFASNLPRTEHVTVSPIFTERALGDWGVERTFTPTKLPVALLQWRPHGRQTLQLAWTVTGAIELQSPQLLHIAAATPFFCHTNVPVAWESEAAGSRTRITLRVTLEAGAPFLLAVSSTPTDIGATALVRTRAADWQRLTESSPMLEIDGKPSTTWLKALHEGDAQALEDVLAKWIGLEPDPERERVRLRPVVLEEYNRLALKRMDLGGAWLDLEWSRAGDRTTFTLDLSYGNLTPRVIFEPLIRGSVTGVWVDGQPAELNLERGADGWTRCPVQLVLDHRREVVLRTTLP